jgi:hypothetical protein
MDLNHSSQIWYLNCGCVLTGFLPLLYYFCNPMNVFVLAILFYLIYRFIGGFIIPLFRTTRSMRQQFNNMNGESNRQNGQQSTDTAPPGPEKKSKPDSSKVGEYIDFEEIQD